jgi:tRNA U34 5-carboxymethylaminomethyl modifying enzyme MnmG/GidA
MSPQMPVFSHIAAHKHPAQMPCWMTHTNEFREIIRRGLTEAPCSLGD